MTQQPKKLTPLSPLALPQTKKKRKPLGALPEQSDQDLEDLAAISPADLVRAQQLWKQNAPTPLKSLLKAQVEDK